MSMTESLMRLQLSQGLAHREQKILAASDKALDAVDSSRPFHEVLQPIVSELQEGLLGMTKVVGGDTAQKDIDPGLLSTVIDVRRRCQQKIVVPMKQMRRSCEARMSELKKMHKGQMAQLQQLKETIREIKGRCKRSEEKMRSIESSSVTLAQRTDATLQYCRDLRPTVTNADIKFAQLLSQIQAKCDLWNEEFLSNKMSGETLTKQIEGHGIHSNLRLSESDSRNCETLLQSQSHTLKLCEDRIKSTEAKVQELIDSAKIRKPPN